MEQTEYKIYKGLQKPLVLFGLKGPNIIWGTGTAVTTFLLGAIAYVLFGGWAAFITALIPASYGTYRVVGKMKHGLHEKKKDKCILIPKNLISRL